MAKNNPETDKIMEAEIRLCKSQGIMQKRTIAKILMAKYPDIFTDIENTRCMVRTRTGSHKNKGSLYSDLTDDFKNVEEVPNAYEVAKTKKTKQSKFYLVTCAVNNTPIHRNFWDNLLVYSQFLNGELHVIASRYKNPTSIFNESAEVWAEEVMPYLDANRHDIHKTISIMSDIKIQPTAEMPLIGLEGISGNKSCIIGHPRVHMTYLPVPKRSNNKVMFTTGACTLANYTDSKAGKKGEFHHTFGFVLVEIKDEEDAVIRYVTAKEDGSFIDLFNEVKDGKITKADRPKAIILGDLHIAKLTKESLIRIDEIISLFKPEVLILHDVFDGESINPHEEKNPILKFKRLNNTLQAELDECIEIISYLSGQVDECVIVASNHDRFLDRYISTQDWKKDLINASTYIELTQMAMTSEKSLIQQIIEKHLPKVKCLDIDESYIVEDIECGSHGDIGANGSKGGALQFKRLSTKLITGHTHTPSRLDGHLVVGCQDLDHGYNKGISSWGIADVIINSNGKTQHLLF